MDGAALSMAIVASYVKQDLRIIDDKARANFLEENYDEGEPSAARAQPSRRPCSH